MATVLTAKQKEVIRKIIYAVETGGQVYGKQNYSSLIGAGANTPNERAITIGAGQWYAGEAKQLLNLIRKTDAATFKKLDNQGIASDLDTKNWGSYAISPSSDKAKCIVSIISSAIGIKCQDALMESQITTYSDDIQKAYGAMSADAIAECINIKHQGGDSALKRILAKTTKPYSAKTIKAALDTDPADKSNNNQVGDYVTRQNKVYDMVNTYLIGSGSSTTTPTTNTTGGKKTMTETQLRSSVANYLVPYVGIREGSAQHLAILKVFNDSGLCTRYKMTKNDAWCATSTSAAFIALGLAGKAGSGKLFECVECACGTMIELAKKQGIWVENDGYVPKIGDVVLYDWQDNGVGDNTGWPDHVGIVYAVTGTSSFRVIEGNKSNTVGYRTMAVNGKFIRGFITPNYAKFASGGTTVTPTPATPSKPATGGSTSTGSTLNKTTVKFKGTVTASELNVRSWAGTDGTKVLRKLKKGTAVDVYDTIHDSDGDEWYYIKEGGKFGFVSAAYIAKSSGTSASTNTSNKGGLNKTAAKFRGKVTASSLRVRSWAGTEYGILRSLKAGTVVEVYDTVKATSGQEWYYIKEGGKFGFVSATYIARM